MRRNASSMTWRETIYIWACCLFMGYALVVIVYDSALSILGKSTIQRQHHALNWCDDDVN